jgi:hypothetical protein
LSIKGTTLNALIEELFSLLFNSLNGAAPAGKVPLKEYLSQQTLTPLVIVQGKM